MAEEMLLFSVVPLLLETIGIKDMLVVRCTSRELCALASEDNKWRNALGKTLIQAARREQTAEVQQLIDRLIVANANLSATDHRQWSAVHYAAERGQDVLVSRLLEAEAGVNQANVDGRTPLHLAAAHGAPPLYLPFHLALSPSLLTLHPEHQDTSQSPRISWTGMRTSPRRTWTATPLFTGPSSCAITEMQECRSPLTTLAVTRLQESSWH